MLEAVGQEKLRKTQEKTAKRKKFEFESMVKINVFQMKWLLKTFINYPSLSEILPNENKTNRRSGRSCLAAVVVPEV